LTTAEALLHHHIDAFKTERRVKAGSVIVTAFGDAIAPRGGVLWLGSLIQLLAPLGINERLVRTAAFRLVKEDWLVALSPHLRHIGLPVGWRLASAGVVG
jgi:hypothetical protein